MKALTGQFNPEATLTLMPYFGLYGKQNQARVMESKEQPPGVAQPAGQDGFLVSEETKNVDASGVDDKSTGMGEGDSDFLGKTNRRDEDED